MNIIEQFHPSWEPLFRFLHQGLLAELSANVLPNCIYYPQKENIFRVFRMPLNKIKVITLGQDPYHGPGQANGLAFAVKENIKTPPSLEIIARELSDEGLKDSHNYDTPWKTLEHWEEQGIFLLNTALTVESTKPGSHLKYWEEFISKVISFIALNQPCIWLLWGKKAQSYTVHIPNKTIFNVKNYSKETIEGIPSSTHFNYILKAAHPAAECYQSNAGFLGCNHFYYVNRILMKNNQEQINW
jgi:uracil-DNA glycosylase